MIDEFDRGPSDWRGRARAEGDRQRRGGVLSARSTVLALVPHFRCEQWLGDCLETLAQQTRSLDGIVVIDDASDEPPVDIVRQFPAVSLLVAPENSGPYRLVQEVMNRTAYDGYLFADADDWSTPDRLELLLREAERSGAEMVGSQEVRVLCDVAEAVPFNFPLDGNAALRARPTSFPLLHPTTVVSRSLVMRVGGYATGMRFGGDAEFLRRAAHVARVVNIPQYCYFRRRRAGSLTSDPATGMHSPARRELIGVLAARALANVAAVERGDRPDLRPYRTAPSIALRHVIGPALREVGVPAPIIRRGAQTPVRVAGAAGLAFPVDPSPPVFVIGSARSGSSLLAYSLGQHPHLMARTRMAWVRHLVRHIDAALTHIKDDSDRSDLGALGIMTADYHKELGRALSRLLIRDEADPDGARATRRRWIGAAPDFAFHVPILAQLFPGARFIHVVRAVDDVVDSLVNVRLSKQDRTKHTAESALLHWLDTVRACVAAERAYGSTAVLRVRHHEWIDDPGIAIRRCLRFIGESFAEPCVRPCAGLDLERSADTAGSDAAASLVAAALNRLPAMAEARLLSAQVLQAPAAAYRADPAAIHALEQAYRAGQPPYAATRKASPLDAIRAEALAGTEAGANIVVVSRGDDRLLQLPDRQATHFPQMEDGTYTGYHPATSDDAIAHLEQLRARGAQFLLFPGTSLWWLDHYEAFRDHLERRYARIPSRSGVCLLFDLAPRPAPHEDEIQFLQLEAVP